VVVFGESELIGKTLYVCTALHCKIHARTGRVPTPKKPGEIDPARAKQVEELWQRRTKHAVRVALHTAVREHQSKEKNSYTLMPLEALRLAVSEACKAIRPQQDGNQYLETLWIPPKGAKVQADSYHTGPLHKVIDNAQDHGTLLRVLLDCVVAQDVAGKFSGGELITTLAKSYSLNLKAVTAPVEKEWNEKKRVSYERREARLAKERAKAKKAAKPEPVEAKPSGEAITKK
jgi:hypothetical protein